MGNETSADDNKMNDHDGKMDLKHSKNECTFIPFKSQIEFSKEMRIKSVAMPQSLFAPQTVEEINTASDGVDRRIEAPVNAFDNNHTNAIYNIVLLRMNFNGTPYKGTATIIHRSLNSLYLLTCAHNVIQMDKNLNEVVTAEGVEFAINQNTKYRWKELACYSKASCVVHPKYAHDPTPTSGHDIAIIKVDIDVDDELLKNIKPLKLRGIESDITSYSGAKVIGYPGEKDGELYGMSGDYNLVNKSTVIKYEKIDTSGGQSGSPIFCHEDNKSNDDDESIFKQFDEIIGVHTAGNVAMKTNLGTALNNEKLQWIANVLKCDVLMQPNYQLNALLISSDPKYNQYMEKLHQTFNRSLVINSKRLYFNNNDGVIRKSHILEEIKKMIHSGHRNILCYCGDSDKNGDWIINKNSENQGKSISFNDVKSLFRGSGGTLFIISDCSYSEKWIIDCNKIPANYTNKKEIIIQASARKDEMAEPGVFISKYSYSCLSWVQKGNGVLDVPRGVTGLAGLVLTIPVSLVYDVGIRNVYHSAKLSTPISSDQYYLDQSEYEIAETNDKQYYIKIALVNSWTKMDTTETVGAGFKYTSFGISGNC